MNFGYEDVIVERVPKWSSEERMTQIKEKLQKDVLTLVRELGGSPLIIDEERFTVAKRFLLLSYLLSELNILIATVWRYKEVPDAWKILNPHLDYALEDIYTIRKKQYDLARSDIDFYSCEMKRLLENFYYFFLKFDLSLDKLLLESAFIPPIPFEAKLLDLLSCSPTADFTLSVISPYRHSKYCNVLAFYNFRNLQYIYDIPKELESNDITAPSNLLRYVRESVRCDNVVFFQRIINDLDSLEVRYKSADDDEKEKANLLEEMSNRYEAVLRELFNEPAYSPCTTDVDHQEFLQDIYRRDVLVERAAALVVSLSVPCLPIEHLPLIVQSQGLNLGDVITTLRQDFLTKGLLKEYNWALNLPIRTEVEIKVSYSDGCSPPSEVNIRASFKSRNTFCISRKDDEDEA